MRPFTTFHWLCTLAVLAASPALAAGERMLHVAWRPVSPQVPTGGFGTSTRNVWRLGDKYVRVEEAPDPEQRIHGLLVIAEPHVWIVNRYDRTGQHVVDPGPTFIAHFPVFSWERSPEVRKLEFGRELGFFSGSRASVLPDRIVDGTRCQVRRSRVDGLTLTLYISRASGNPFQVDLEGGARDYSIRYEKYETGLVPDLSKFQPPAGVTFNEGDARE